jgi:hypothetical protein
MNRIGLLLLPLVLLPLAGCQNDEIRTYTVPRAAPEAGEHKVRLLGAIFEDGPNQWFFKLLGPTADIDKHASDFDHFVESLRFTGKPDDPVTWQAPPAWKKAPADGLRFATFYLGGPGQPPEVRVFKLDKVSTILDNVNRWCDNDLGRPHLTPGELEKVTKSIKAGPHTGVRVDLTGPGKRPPMAAAKRPGPKPLPLTYSVPTGWKETGPRTKTGILILTTFQVRDGGEQAEVQVTPIAGPGIGLLENVNRWRQQVGLGAIGQAELDRSPPEKVRIGGEQGQLVDLAGPANRQLVAWVRHGEKTWYFKMLGAKELVGKQRAAFDSFLQSVKFTGAADE